MCGSGREFVMGEGRVIAWGSRFEGRDRALIRDGNPLARTTLLAPQHWASLISLSRPG